MRFPTTVWSRIRSGDYVVRHYREPIYRFLVGQRVHPEDARDLTHDVLIQLLAPGFLDRADPSLGRFRSLVLTVTDRVHKMWLRRRVAQKRGGAQTHVAFDDATVLEIIDEARSRPMEAVFVQAWSETLLRRAMQRLHQDHAVQCDVLRLKYMESRSSTEIEGKLSLGADQVRNHLHRGKKRLEALLVDEIKSYCSTTEELEAELRDLHLSLA